MSGDPDYAAMARDELDRALTLSWRELSRIIPWGDSFEGVTPAGREVVVERAYLWREKRGGDILCEVAVYGGLSHVDQGESVSALIPRSGA